MMPIMLWVKVGVYFGVLCNLRVGFVMWDLDFIQVGIFTAEDFSIKKEENIDDDSDAEELSKIDFTGEFVLLFVRRNCQIEKQHVEGLIEEIGGFCGSLFFKLAAERNFDCWICIFYIF